MGERFRSLEDIRSFADCLSCPVLVTRGRLILAANDAYLAVIGYPREKIEGRSYLDFIPPEERARLERRAVLRAQGLVPPARLTSLVVKADGTSSIVHVEPTVIPTTEGDPFILNMVFVLPDRDAEIELAELLVSVSSRLAGVRSVLDVRKVAVACLADAGYDAAFFDRHGSTIFPLGAELPAQTQRADLDEALAENRPVFVGVLTEMPSAVVVPMRRGAEAELLTIAGPRLATPLRAALGLFARGVASALETASLIADLERQNHELTEARAEVLRHERLAALGEMAATIAHEVRNPVAVISNAITTLRREADGASTALSLLAIIDEECLRLARMIRDLLDFAKPRPMNLMLEPLAEIAEEAILAATNQPDPAVSAVRFQLERGRNVPDVEVDRHLLRQSLVNLLVNAAQASPAGAVVRVDVGVTERDGKPAPCISVIDQGRGIPEALASRIFEPFFTTRPRGTGLGLAVVRQIADQLGCEIEVDGAPGRGATFRLVFGRSPQR
jgi:PAS domain S-box-containing protein